MPKSSPSKSASARKPAPKPAGKPAAKPAAPKKPAPASKPSAAKPASKPAAAKPSAKPAPAPAKPAAAAKPAPARPAAKPAPAPAKPAASAPAAKAPVKPAAGAPKPAPAAPGKPAPAPSKPAPAAPAPAAVGDAKKPGPKGITIVTPKPMRKPKAKKLEMPISEPLLKPGLKWKPLIASGPKNPALTGGAGDDEAKPLPKAKLPKKELDRYKAILLQKRSELIGDVRNMEEEALRTSSGSLSSLPQHMAEQGSDTFEQSLSLDLAQVDRNLIREIDDALKRIEEGTYGVCLLTGKLISPERLNELPWAKYSIEAARELERRPYITNPSAASLASGAQADRSSDR